VPHDVVISYSRRNRDVADRLVELLRARGLDVWYDRMIRTGADWRDEIANAIAGSRCFVILFSSESNASEELRKEYSIAERRDLLIIPIRIENVEPTGFFEYELARRQWFDAFADRDAELAVAAAQVADALKPEPSKPAPELKAKAEPPPVTEVRRFANDAPASASGKVHWLKLVLPAISLVVGLFAPIGMLVWPVLQVFMVHIAAKGRPHAWTARAASFAVIVGGLAVLATWSLGFDPDEFAVASGYALAGVGAGLAAFLAFRVVSRGERQAAIWIATALGSALLALGAALIAGRQPPVVWWTVMSLGMTIASAAYLKDAWNRAKRTEP
jgi:hypothetical protein